MFIRVDQGNYDMLVDRQDLSNLVYACLHLLANPALKQQTVAGLNITCRSQHTHISEFDPARVECREFIEVMNRRRNK